MSVSIDSNGDVANYSTSAFEDDRQSFEVSINQRDIHIIGDIANHSISSFEDHPQSFEVSSNQQHIDDIIGGEGTSTRNELGSINVKSIDASHIHKPDVADEFKPSKLMRFKTIDDAIQMYKNYALLGGFNVRKYTQTTTLHKIIKTKYLVCSNNGKVQKKSFDTMAKGKGRDKRNSNFKVTDCQAKIVFRIVPGNTHYYIYMFQEMHNHPFEDTRHLRESRKLSVREQEYIVRASTSKLGATRAHKLQVSLNGGYENYMPKVSDYKNCRRDICNIIGDMDAQMIVNIMEDRKKHYRNFSFEYRCDESVLDAMFWADETDKAYYQEFGDVISFDATFRSNKYDMVFVPFTAINHNRQSVTVGAGLLCNESIGSYKWLLESFVKAHGKQPKLVLTDQDAAVKQAVECVFPDSKHRLCMWHIMKKLQNKVCNDIIKNTDFRKRFIKIVWDIYTEVDEFEENWNSILREFKLEDMRWFKDMYNIRDFWIPAFFKHIPMSGLMKTTSRSESINSFFNKYNHDENLLCNFIMNYDTAIQKQRNSEQELDYSTKKATYTFKTPRKIERQAADVYTKTIFYLIQKEIYKAAWYCSESNGEVIDGVEVFKVYHKNQNNEIRAECKVEIKLTEKVVNCSCEHFSRMGFLCRHDIRILMKKDIDEIPEQYILNRWRKDVISSRYQLARHGCEYGDNNFAKNIRATFSNIEKCLDLVRDDDEKMASLVEKTKLILKEFEDTCTTKPESNKKISILTKLMGVSIPEVVEVQVPEVQRNKGCRPKKRIPSQVEKEIENSKRASRFCSGCGLKVPHNSRTCPVRLAREQKENHSC